MLLFAIWRGLRLAGISGTFQSVLIVLSIKSAVSTEDFQITANNEEESGLDIGILPPVDSVYRITLFFRVSCDFLCSVLQNFATADRQENFV